MKALRAAHALTSLATLPDPIERRTPFFICALAVSTMIHVGYMAMTNEGTQSRAAIKAKIQLGIEALKRQGGVWPVGESTRNGILEMYRRIAAI